MGDREGQASPANVQSQREKSSPQNQLSSEHISCVQGTKSLFPNMEQDVVFNIISSYGCSSLTPPPLQVFWMSFSSSMAV